MANNDAKGFRAEWAAATPSRKAVTVAAIVAVIAVVVLVIVPLMQSLFTAGQNATR